MLEDVLTPPSSESGTTSASALPVTLRFDSWRWCLREDRCSFSCLLCVCEVGGIRHLISSAVVEGGLNDNSKRAVVLSRNVVKLDKKKASRHLVFYVLGE